MKDIETTKRKRKKKAKINWPPVIFKKQTWEGWGKSLAGITKCETCGKKYNNYLGITGDGGVPFAKVCYSCVYKHN
jgi:hypothetical protein